MLKNIIFILFASLTLFSCGEEDSTESPYIDFDKTMTAIECSFLKKQNQEMVDRLLNVSILFTNAVYELDNNCDYNGWRVRINLDFESARKSTLRHEFFAHRYPHLILKDINRNHEEKFKSLEKELNNSFNVCWQEVVNE